MVLFGKKKELDEDFFQFSIDITRWVISNFDGVEQLRKTPLVTPAVTFFPESKVTGHERATEIFNHVKDYADMSDWACNLIPETERAPHHLGDSIMQKFEADTAAGTFSETLDGDETRSVITYDPHLLRQPYELIATFSHELAHLLMTSARDFPFPSELEEPVTDALAIMMGFGIFIANGSSGFRTDDQGWEYHRSGYLCEGEILHVLAAFSIISGNDPKPAKAYLKPHLAKRFSKILDSMLKRPEIRELLAC